MELRDSPVSENTSRQCLHRLPVVMAPPVLEPASAYPGVMRLHVPFLILQYNDGSMLQRVLPL